MIVTDLLIFSPGKKKEKKKKNCRSISRLFCCLLQRIRHADIHPFETQISLPDTLKDLKQTTANHTLVDILCYLLHSEGQTKAISRTRYWVCINCYSGSVKIFTESLIDKNHNTINRSIWEGPRHKGR